MLWKQWWIRLDKVSFFSAVVLMLIGLMCVSAALPCLIRKGSLLIDYMFLHHIVVVILSITVLCLVSYLDINNVKLLCLVLFATSLILTFSCPLIGSEIKGARRWLRILGVSLQPSEFIKPSFVVLNALFLAKNYKAYNDYYLGFAVLALMGVCLALFLQPDFGMSISILFIWFIQLFIYGIRLRWLLVIAVSSAALAYLAILSSPHILDRIARFLYPDQNDCFQINQAILAIKRGGFFGVGLGEGVVKKHLPDAHADFIFAVICEELGCLACCVIIALFSLIIYRAYIVVKRAQNLFIIFSLYGLIGHLAWQMFLNIGSNTRLLPTKGATLPFISYGGSSLVATSIIMGLILNLTSYKTDYRLRDY